MLVFENNPLLALMPFAVMAATLGFSLYVAWSYSQRNQRRGVVRQIVVFVIAMFLFSSVGVLLIAPTGPGSGAPVFLVSLVPCAFFLIVGPNLSRVLAGVLACVCIVGAIESDRARVLHGARLQARLRERASAIEQGRDQETRQPEPGVGADSR
jgi:hypothetical protein